MSVVSFRGKDADAFMRAYQAGRQATNSLDGQAKLALELARLCAVLDDAGRSSAGVRMALAETVARIKAMERR